MNRFNNFYISFIGTIFYVLSPRIYGSSFYNNKDTLFLSLVTIALYYCFKSLDNLNYKNILPSTSILQSQNKQYVNEFIKIEKKRKSNLIELHNRPIYLNYLVNSLSNRTYILYFHNDPLSMSGSKTIELLLNLNIRLLNFPIY